MAEKVPPAPERIAAALAWARSEEGQAAIKQALAEARALTAELREARMVDWRRMNIPMTQLDLR